MELAYRIALSEEEELSAGALVQTSPGHVAGARASLRHGGAFKRHF